MIDVAVAALLVTTLAGPWWLLRDLRSLQSCGTHRGEAASVSVVIPARDEENTLPALLQSLQALAVGVREVLVVDDDSRDATAAVARDAGASVLSAGGPPRGWTGKAWACHLGAQATVGDLLLFLDADTVLAPDALDALLDIHDGHPGLLSVQPAHTVERPYEQLSSYFNAVSVLASGAFRGRPGGRPMAFGPCLLTSRTDYERVGGHLTVRHEVLDDVQLAVAYRKAGLPVRCFIGGRSVTMRSYPGGLRQLTDGWTKNFASGAAAASPGPAIGAASWIGAHHAVAVGATLSLTAVATGHDVPLAHGDATLWTVAWVVVAWQLRSTLRRLGSFRWWTWALFPVPLLAFDIVFGRSLVRTVVRRSVRWRGRDVRLRARPSADEGA
jgi:4,4'-diaponeurosporenoate glycosyltransferase